MDDSRDLIKDEKYGGSVTREYEESIKSFAMTKPKELSYIASFLKQLRIMLVRNFTLLRKSYVSTFCQVVLGPVVFMLLLYGLQKALDAKVLRAIDHPGTYDLGPLDNCQGETRSSSCINMMYTPSNSDTDAIMQRFANKNMQRSGLNSDSSNAIRYEGAFDLGVQDSPKRKYGVVSVPDTQFVYDYVLYNPNTTAFAVSFEVNRNDNQFKYQLWYNTTVQRNGTSPYNTRVLGIMRGLDEAIIGYSGNKDANIDVTLKDWPKVPPKSSGDLIISSLGPMFFFSAQMVIFINVLMMIVGEKEKKLREAMQVVGLRSEVYWLSWYLAYAVLEFFCVLVTMGMSYALGFAAFTNSNLFAMFFTFYIFNLSCWC
ncbi:ABC transporter A family member 1 [Zancudomyces culisetae]|uniref:ABC transporter A family member 1 n=1 Tax=Zancudomyces culisetae TaxID=1213189 RepID=A0A1R1PM71_ZANCU|nr:ABC transporter A family member 1 [Zancudomyces culisetae]|eukprot:OMH81972.1 ABC transporter A family member 1 [Zancudomyces culisetae]